MLINKKNLNGSLGLKAGELVEVKTKQEILATLDKTGCLDGLPFMPEMFRYCGMRFHVYKRAHKTCDTVFTSQGRRMRNAVHLETRCDGSAHGNCQAACLIFWKEVWLKRVHRRSVKVDNSASCNGKHAQRETNHTCVEEDIWTQTGSVLTGDKPSYVCQATRLPYATTELNWWELDQYIEDYRSGNVGIARILSGLVYKACYQVKNKRGIGRLVRWSYDHLPPLWGGSRWPLKKGAIAMDQRTPTVSLNLQPGELVRVKTYEDILATLNRQNMNRGMTFDKEMVPYCGGVYRVRGRVHRIINEKTGKMQAMKSPCIVLDSVVCQSRYSECRLFCPRSIYPYWREIWLERINESDARVEQRAN